MRVLVTGAQGYIGTELVKKLIKIDGWKIIGTDVGYFKNCTVSKEYEDPINIINQDIRNFDYDLLNEIDCVVHLAAICNDPLGDLSPNITREINTLATTKLAQEAKSRGVTRFIFFSSCIMYGANSTSLVDENSVLDPKTAYAISKVDAEKELIKLSDNNFAVIFVRNGTIYGYSERMRFDTVLNSFVGSLLKKNIVEVLGDGQPWRPICHLDDVCNSVIGYIKADKHKIKSQAFNNGDDILNYRIGDLAAKVSNHLNLTYEIKGKKDADNRTYKASFGKIKKILPEIKFKKMPEESAKEMYLKFKPIDINIIDNKKFLRLKWIEKLIKENTVDENLYFNK